MLKGGWIGVEERIWTRRRCNPCGEKDRICYWELRACGAVGTETNGCIHWVSWIVCDKGEREQHVAVSKRIEGDLR